MQISQQHEMLKRNLWDKLDECGLIPSEHTYRHNRLEITRLGKRELPATKSLIGDQAWQYLLDNPNGKFSEPDIVRLLGFGMALTDFVVAVLPLPKAGREQVVRLGAQLNLFVVLFDHFVDSGVNANAVLSRKSLKSIVSGRVCFLSNVLGRLSPPSAKILPDLVANYYRNLQRLPFAGVHRQTFETINNIIVRMYDAECLTLTSKIDTFHARRKSALPFVVMGMPGWLALSDIDWTKYLGHMKWLYQLGLFFGSVDDLIDLSNDRVHNHPNQFQSLIEDGRINCSRSETVAVEIASLGKRIMQKWTDGFGKSPAGSAIRCKEALRVCLASWYGGLSYYKNDPSDRMNVLS